MYIYNSSLLIMLMDGRASYTEVQICIIILHK